MRDEGFAWSPPVALSRESRVTDAGTRIAPTGASRGLRLRELWFAGLLVAILACAPAAAVQAAGWSERLQPVPWIALLGVVVGVALARSRVSSSRGLVLGLLGGLALVTLQYAWFQSNEEIPRRILTFLARMTDWFGAAFSGAASTDNLLFAYTMGLLAWTLGFLGSWFAFRRLTPWWAIIPGGGALLLNLSYAPPDLLWLVTVQLVSSFLLLIA